jgi:hypothetical protein
MQTIDPDALSTVTGGFGALLGSLAQAAGPILNGVAGIIGASTSGGGGGGAPSAPSGGAAPAPGGIPSGGGSDPLVSVSVTINGVAQR